MSWLTLNNRTLLDGGFLVGEEIIETFCIKLAISSDLLHLIKRSKFFCLHLQWYLPEADYVFYIVFPEISHLLVNMLKKTEKELINIIFKKYFFKV